MGGLKNFGRGLGAGLQVLGQGIINKEVREEDKRRFDEQSAREEKRLKIAEDDAASRQKMAELDLAMKKVEYNNKMLVDQITKNNFDPVVTGRAFSQFGPSGGRIYEYDPVKSREIGPEGVYYDIYVPETDANGNPLLTDQGTIKKKRLAPGSNTLEFQNQKELTQYFVPLMNGDYMLAHELSKIKAEETFNQSVELFDKKMKADNEFYEKYKNTPMGEKFRAEQQRAGLENKKLKQEINRSEAETAKTQAETEAIKNPAPAGLKPKDVGGTMQSLTGKEVKRTKGEAQQDLETFRVASKKYNDVTSPQQAFWINEIKENPTIRKKFSDRVQQVIEGTTARAEFLAQAAKLGLSREFAAEFLDQAEADAEAWKEASDSEKPNLLIRTWDTIIK